MSKTKLLPTSAPKPIPPEFLEKFAAHGWRRVENMWGRSTVMAWRNVIGAKVMQDARRWYQHDQEFRRCFIEGGWRGIEQHYGAKTEAMLKWIERCGGIKALQADRSEAQRQRYLSAKADLARGAAK